MESYLKTYNATDGITSAFRLFPRQKEFVKTLSKERNTIAIKHRQCGISTCSTGYIASEMVFARPDKPIIAVFVADKLSLSEELLVKLKNFLLDVPRWFWGKEFYHPDPDNPINHKPIFKKENKAYVELFNGSKAYARSSSESSTRGISSVSHLILDEAAFIRNSKEVYSAALASMSAVKDSKVIMISTPNGHDPLYYDTYQQAVDGKNNFKAVVFKWFQDPRYNRHLKWVRIIDGQKQVLKEETVDSKGNIPYNEERWEKLISDGYKPTSPWYEGICKSMNNDKRKIAQEIELSFLGSSNTVVDAEVIRSIEENDVLPIDEYENYPLRYKAYPEIWIWEEHIPGHRYICGVDNATGNGEDSTSVQILDVDAVDDKGNPCIKQVFEYCGKINGGDVVTDILMPFCEMYEYPMVIVENIGGYGSSTLMKLQEMGYPNIYETDPSLKNPTMTYKQNVYKPNKDAIPGFTQSHLRVHMVENFVTMLSKGELIIRSKRVVHELKRWVYKQGRADHSRSSHDDNIMCIAMSVFVYNFMMQRQEQRRVVQTSRMQAWLSLANNKNDSTTYNKLGIPNYHNTKSSSYGCAMPMFKA